MFNTNLHLEIIRPSCYLDDAEHIKQKTHSKNFIGAERDKHVIIFTSKYEHYDQMLINYLSLTLRAIVSKFIICDV